MLIICITIFLYKDKCGRSKNDLKKIIIFSSIRLGDFLSIPQFHCNILELIAEAVHQFMTRNLHNNVNIVILSRKFGCIAYKKRFLVFCN